jgi:hypothetical protein
VSVALAVLLATACTSHSDTQVAVAGVNLPGCEYAAAPSTDVPDGPATGAITGAAVSSTIDFTRNLTITPPPAGYRPTVTQDQAICALGSAVSTGPAGYGPVALATVTLSGPQPAGVPAYQHRVAWVQFGYSPDAAPSCPAVFPEPSATASTAPPEWPTPNGGPEQVTAIDASTGGSAMFLDEHYVCAGDPPAPTVGVPLQIQSVPWTLVSRTADSATLRAGWPSCEAFAANEYVGPPPGVDSFTLAEYQRESGTIPIRVWRPLGPTCGPNVSHDITVSTDRPGQPLPTALAYAPLGIESRYDQPAYATPPAPAASPAPVATATEVDSCSDPVAANKLLLADATAGPAHGKAARNVVTAGWSLDGGALTVSPPPAGYLTTVSEGVAGCRLAFASRVATDPTAAGKLELGTVTIRSDIAATVPGTPSYQHRVAWLLVTNPLWTSECPSAPVPTVDPYEVLMLDATTGTSGITYQQSHPWCDRSMPAKIAVPNEKRSVPWSLVSRAPDSSSVVVTASWPTCEIFIPVYQDQVVTPPGVLKTPAVRDDPTEITIEVGGALGAQCGASERHTIVVGPATPGRSISTTILRGALGTLDDTGPPGG